MQTKEKLTSDKPWETDATPFIRIDGVSRHFGDFAAVNDVSLDIYQGELFAILGGSGCGKTTLLRMLGGFDTPTAGRIVIDGVDMAGIPPFERPVNMMFQSYALFPHMTVQQNVAYGLVREGCPKNEIESRVREMLEVVKLPELANRKPDQLSGGQRQRVALARALVKRPKVLLLDEPLGALDKKLREHTQFELANIQFDLGVTFVVVTHDQEEAMTLSSRIAVMDAGRFVQVGTPTDIYEYPATRFIADFIGNINMFEASLSTSNDERVRVDCPALGMQTLLRESDLPPGAVTVALRPEKIFIDSDPPPNAETRHVVKGIVDDLGYFGNLTVYRVMLESGEILQVSRQNRRRSERRSLNWEDEVFVWWNADSLLVLAE
jgi:putrescine transport system ATP-binding protein